jgi:hypothetical protein
MLNERQLKSPKRYLYEIGDLLGWRDYRGNVAIPVFTDPAAQGYMFPWGADTEAEAKENLEYLKEIAETLKIPYYKPRLKRKWHGTIEAIIVVPRYDPENPVRPDSVYNEVIANWDYEDDLDDNMSEEDI